MVLLVVVWIVFLHRCYGSLLLCQQSECTSYNLSKNKSIEIPEGRVRHISAVYQKCNCIGNLIFTSEEKKGLTVHLDINCKNYTYFTKHGFTGTDTGFFGNYTSNQNFETSIIRNKSSLIFVDLSTKKRTVIKQNITDRALNIMTLSNLTFNTAQHVTLGSETCFSDVVISSCTCDSPTVVSLAAINATHVQCIGSGLYYLRFKWLINGQEIQNMSIIRSESYDNYTATSVLEVSPNSPNNTTVTCIVTSRSKNQSRSMVLYEERNSGRKKEKKSTNLVIIIICSIDAVIVAILLVVLILISRRRQHRKPGSNTTQTSKNNERIYELLPCNDAGSTLQNQLEEDQCDTRRGSQYVSCYNILPTTLSRDDECDAYNHLDLGKGEISNLQQIKRNEEFKALNSSSGMQSMEGVTEDNTGRVKCKVIVEMKPTTPGSRVEPPQVYEYMG